MPSLDRLLQSGRVPRVIGFDDAPFERAAGSPVSVSGIVCTGTRMEGMVWGTATRDGDDATDVLCALLRSSKFHEQVHLVLLDGIAIGGFNVVDLPLMSERLGLPCVAVMRRMPDLPAVRGVLSRFEDAERRLALLDRAGPIHTLDGFVFQCVGLEPDVVARALTALTDRGKVPEALRLAHLIGAAVKTGQSGRRA
jgi:endonuclease V-like protein UPF0215 family